MKSRGGQNRIDLSGQRFGRLIVFSYHGSTQKKALWICACDCGGMKIVRSETLRRGLTRSCGCLRKEVTAAKNFRHGHSVRGDRNRHYAVWLSMMQRCYTPTCRDFYLYGERGIKVCDEWHDPAVFVAWCEAHEPIPSGHSLDRKNTNGNYTPDNCRFADAVTQSRNRRHPREWRWTCAEPAQ